MQIIDSHCHIGLDRDKKLISSELIKMMDECKVDKAIVCSVDKYIAVYNKEGNDFLIKAVKEFPDRLIGFATVNPWYGERAVKELKRAISNGLKGLKLNSSLQGFILNDELVYPLIKTAQSLEIPVYFHTGTPICAMPFQLAEIALQFPEVNFIMGHMGFSDFWYDTVPAAKKSSNIYLETSFIDVDTINKAIKEVGIDRIIFGSDVPVSNMRLELNKINLLEVGNLEKEKILEKNIGKLLEAGK